MLAPNAKLRSKVVAYGSAAETAETAQLPAVPTNQPSVAAPPDPAEQPQPAAKRRRPNYSWAELMRRSFAIDALECERCGGRLKLLAAVMSPKAVRAILASLGLPTEAPELRPARAPPEQFDAA